MKCPSCGSVRCRYLASRKKHWKRRMSRGTDPRTNFDAVCPVCGFKGKVK